MKQKIETMNFTAVHTEIGKVAVGGQPALRVVKKDKIQLPDENTYARLDGVQFHNGVIEAKFMSRLLPGAPSHARGFLGIVFRANENDSEFECFYVRPTNGRDCSDPARKAHGCQYFSYPGYTFSYFREFGIAKHEAPVELALNEWFALKAVIQDQRGEFYLNGSDKPVLVVEDMKHGKGGSGSVGIFVDIGTEGFVSEFNVTCTD